MMQTTENIPLQIHHRKATTEPNDVMNWLRVPNTIVQMSGGFSLLQLRFIITIIAQMQDFIKEREHLKRDKNIRIDINEVISIFKGNLKGDVVIDIPLRECGVKAYQYGELRNAVKQMNSIPVEIGDKKYNQLFSVETSEKYSKYITIRISKEMLLNFINTDKGFTRFTREGAMSVRNKYSIRIYLLAASWRERGVCRVSYANLRKWLGIDSKYKEFKDFNRRVLKASAKELSKVADCWFETDEIVRDSHRKPQSIRFSIVRGKLSIVEMERFTLQSNQLYNLLRNHLKFKNEHIEELRPYVNFGTIKSLLAKTVSLFPIIDKNITTITNIPNYCLKSLIKEMT